MNSAQLILTVMAEDQPGIVDKVSKAVVSSGGNWLESNMSRLAGKFTGIVSIECPQEKVTDVKQSLALLSNTGIRVLIDESTSQAIEPGQLINLYITSNDRPGIVSEVSSALASVGANVLSLHTECSSAAMSAGFIFEAKITSEVPLDFDVSILTDVLEKLSDDLIVDIVE